MRCENCGETFEASIIARTFDGSIGVGLVGSNTTLCRTCADAFHAHDWVAFASRNIEAMNAAITRYNAETRRQYRERFGPRGGTRHG